jgi:benzoate 4-monooxygenase
LYEIARHPTWQSKLHSEIVRLPKNEYLSEARLSKLDTLQAILKEALRLHSPFSGPFERVVAPGAETAIANTERLPAGTRIWSSLYAMGRSKEVFGESVDDFRPERWLQSTPERAKGMDDMLCYFGRGSRRCIGQDIASMVLEKTVAAVSIAGLISEIHEAVG